ncbi:hypothetical protein OKW46_003241 [Paraburkholderia sp. WSM4179]|nr:hypothetical protein [Paraburkholderia sp. WSM4179]
MCYVDERSEETLARQNILAAQQAIWTAVKEGWPEFYVEPPKHELTSGTCDRLTLQQIDAGVRAFILACNLSGGSVGDVQLYELLHAYLQSPEARQRINHVVQETGLRRPGFAVAPPTKK